MPDDPPRLVDPSAPTAAPLRALLQALAPRDPSDEADQRIEARLFESLADLAAESPSATAQPEAPAAVRPRPRTGT